MRTDEQRVGTIVGNTVGFAVTLELRVILNGTAGEDDTLIRRGRVTMALDRQESRTSVFTAWMVARRRIWLTAARPAVVGAGRGAGRRGRSSPGTGSRQRRGPAGLVRPWGALGALPILGTGALGICR